MKKIIVLILLILIFYFVEHKIQEDVRQDILDIKNNIDVDKFRAYAISNPYDNMYVRLFNRYAEKYKYVYTVVKEEHRNKYYYWISSHSNGYQNGELKPISFSYDDYHKAFIFLEDYQIHHSVTFDHYGFLMSTYILLDDNLLLGIDREAYSFYALVMLRCICITILITIIIFLLMKRGKFRWKK